LAWRGHGREVELIQKPGGEGDQVVEPGADGVGIDEEDLDVLGEDMLIDPSLPLGGGHLLGVEPGEARCDLGEELEEARGKLGRASVAKKDQHLGSVAKVCGDPSEEPALFGSAPRGGKGLASRDKLAGEGFGIADLEGKQIVGGAVEIGGKLDESAEETTGTLWNEAVGPDSSEKLVLKAVVLREELFGQGIVLRDRESRRDFLEGRQLDVEVVLVHQGGDRQEMAKDEVWHEAGGFADRRRRAKLAVGEGAELAGGRFLGRDKNLAKAEAGDESRAVVASELGPEGGRQSPEVGKERAGITTHQAAGEDEGGDAREVRQAVGGLGLGGAGVVELVGLVEDQEVEVAGVAAKDVLGEGIAVGWDGLVEEFSTGPALRPDGALVENFEPLKHLGVPKLREVRGRQVWRESFLQSRDLPSEPEGGSPAGLALVLDEGLESRKCSARLTEEPQRGEELAQGEERQLLLGCLGVQQSLDLAEEIVLESEKRGLGGRTGHGCLIRGEIALESRSGEEIFEERVFGIGGSEDRGQRLRQPGRSIERPAGDRPAAQTPGRIAGGGGLDRRTLRGLSRFGRRSREGPRRPDRSSS
jgi:hypothetical protein